MNSEEAPLERVALLRVPNEIVDEVIIALGTVGVMRFDISTRYVYSFQMFGTSDELQEEIDDLRAMLRKVQGAVGWWAALSYVHGTHSSGSRWTEKEQQLLQRAGLTR